MDTRLFSAFLTAVFAAGSFFPYYSPPLAQAQENKFSDIHVNYPYAAAVQKLVEEDVVQGYPDNTFRPAITVNRAEFVTLALRASGTYSPTPPTTRCFSDVPTNAWYAGYVCGAKNLGIVSGKADGKFHPADPVVLVEAAKMMTGAMKVKLEDVTPGSPWYTAHLDALSTAGYLPPSFQWTGQHVARGEVAEMLWRIRGQYHDQPHTTAKDLQTVACQAVGDELDNRFDMERVRTTWFTWINEARTKAGLRPYSHSAQLDRTAVDWSKIMRDRGTISHKRDVNDAYYNYAKISSWFAARGIVAKNVSTVTFTENIGGGYLECGELDCTDELIKAIRPTFDAYMKEGNLPANSTGRAHYNSVMNKYFKEIGFGVAFSGTRVFSTTHYITEIVSNPAPICR